MCSSLTCVATFIDPFCAQIRFFSQMEVHRRIAIGRLLNIEYFAIPGTTLFQEGDPGDKFYMLVEGRIGIFKDGKKDAETEEGRRGRQVGAFNESSPYPWFGEMALVDPKNHRSATAIVLEPAKLLSLSRTSFAAFVEIVPTFQQMFATSVVSYTALNKLTKKLKMGEAANKARRAAREAAEDVEVGSILPQTEALAAFDDMIERITPSPSPSHKSPASRDNSPAGRRSFKSQYPQQQPQPQNEFERAHMASIARKPMTASVLSKAGLS